MAKPRKADYRQVTDEEVFKWLKDLAHFLAERFETPDDGLVFLRFCVRNMEANASLAEAEARMAGRRMVQ